MKDKAILVFLIMLMIYGTVGIWQLSVNPFNWFRKVEAGQVWIWDKDDPFDCLKNDTISIISVRGNYVRVKTKPWYGNGRAIYMSYRKQLFNQSSFHRIK